jgi:tetratricopeptide (TPR) repeat protein
MMRFLVTVALATCVCLAPARDDVPSPRELIAQARAEAARVKEPLARDQILTSIVEAQCLLGDDQGALATTKHLPAGKVSFRSLALQEVAVAQAAHGKIKAAMQTFATIPAGIWRDRAARRIAVLQEKTGDRKSAEQMVRSIKGSTQKLRALLKLAAVGRGAGDAAGTKKALAAAGEVASAIPDVSDRAECWGLVGTEQAKLGEKTAAQDSFRRARHTADKLKDDTDRAYVYYRLVLTQAEVADIEGAWETTRLLRDETDLIGTRIRDKSMRAIVRALSQTGKLAQAERTASQIVGLGERAHALAYLAEAERQKGDAAHAKQTLQRARKLVGRGSSPARWLALAEIAKCLIALKDFNGARHVAESVDAGIRNEILANVAVAECQAGDFKAAVRTLNSIPAGDHKNSAVRAIAAERVRRKEPGTLGWAEHLPTPAQRAYALLGIADGLQKPHDDLGGHALPKAK